MTNTEQEATVREAAETYGIDLDADAVTAYAAELKENEDMVGSLVPDTPESIPASGVHEASDEHNAFLYRFKTDPASEGRLSDIEVAVKDNMAVAGVPMTCGSQAVDFTPPYHATVVSRLLNAGAEVVGTTNMDEFAYFTTSETCAHGPVKNPNASGGVPGGSSSGSGAAVAAGAVEVALGSDTGGSIRIPASFCGVVGLKPTHGVVPRFGFGDLAPSLDHIGPLADSVRNAARTLEVISGMDTRDPSTYRRSARNGLVEAITESAEDLSIAVIQEAMSEADDGVAETVDETVTALESENISTDRVSLEGFEQLPIVSAAITATEFTTLVATDGVVHGTGTGYSEEWRETVANIDSNEIGDNPRDWLILGRALTQRTNSEPYVAAQNARRRFTEAVQEILADHDALVLPTTPMTAPDFGEVDDTDTLLRTIAHTGPFNLTGHPAISVPCGEVDQRPVGFQIVTAYDDEQTAVKLGATVEDL